MKIARALIVLLAAATAPIASGGFFAPRRTRTATTDHRHCRHHRTKRALFLLPRPSNDEGGCAPSRPRFSSAPPPPQYLTSTSTSTSTFSSPFSPRRRRHRDRFRRHITRPSAAADATLATTTTALCSTNGNRPEVDIDDILERRDVLSSFSLFRDLDGHEEQVLAESLEEIFVKEGANVITQGAEGEDTMFFVKKGTFDCVDDKARSGAGPFFGSWLPEKVVATLKEGDHFGELSLFLDEPRAVSVRASSAGGAVAWRVNGASLEGLDIARIDDMLELRKALREKYRNNGGKATLDAFFELLPNQGDVGALFSNMPRNETRELLDSARSMIRHCGRGDFADVNEDFEEFAQGVVRTLDAVLHELPLKMIRAEMNPDQRQASMITAARSVAYVLLSWLLLANACTSLLVGTAWTGACWSVPGSQPAVRRQAFFHAYTLLSVVLGPLLLPMQGMGAAFLFERYRKYFRYVERRLVPRRTRSLYPLWSQAVAAAMAFAANLGVALVTSIVGIGFGSLVGYCRWR